MNDRNLEKNCNTCKYLFAVLCMHEPLTKYKNKPNIFKPSNCYKHHYKYWESKDNRGDKE